MAARTKAPVQGGNNGATKLHASGRKSACAMSTAAAPSAAQLTSLMPAIIAALSFSGTDILLKVTYASGMDVLTLASLRGLTAVAFFWAWLRIAPPLRRHTGGE